MTATRLRGATISTLLMLGILLGSAAPASSEGLGTQIAEGAFDILILRPGGVVASVGGTALFGATTVILAPFDFFAGNWGREWPRVSDSLETFVLGPAEYTFQRPLGEF